jgi:histidinol dehydrogenase
VRARRFQWRGPEQTAAELRSWAREELPSIDVGPIRREVREGGDEAVLRLTARFDATERAPSKLRVDGGGAAAVAALEGPVREAMEVAAANIRAVAAAQLDERPREITLPQGHTVSLREVAVRAAGIYAPGGQAAYPSSVLMCAIPARVAGVERIALASPPGPDGELSPLVLAAAELCGIEEVYAMGGAQAIFALAYGTESVEPVDLVAGPGNAWVVEAKRAVIGEVGIDSLAGPSELMVIAGHDADPRWAALDLCAQAEHGGGGALVAAAVEEEVLDRIGAEASRAAADRPGVEDAPLALVQVPDLGEAVELANAFAPEHLELLEEDASLLAGRVRTAGCIFAGRHSATAFGDYVAGSNHVLPTGGSGRFSGPLGPATFRRPIATVEVPADAAARLAPQADALARAEGLPIHGESAMIRSGAGSEEAER